MDINQHDFIKKGASIYLVKNFRKEGKGFILDYYFRSTIKESGIINSNDTRDLYEHELPSIKHPSDKEIVIIKNKIRKEFPIFHFETPSNNNINFLTEKICLDFLKEKGYLVFKPV